MIAIRTDGPTHWSVYAPNVYDPSREARYFGPDTLDACVEAARTLHSVMPTPARPMCDHCGTRAAEYRVGATDCSHEHLRCYDCTASASEFATITILEG